jgi:hypothetical protein
MRVFLDDRRTPPDSSWVLVSTPAEAIALLLDGDVTELSLDHDLGLLNADGQDEATGYDVLLFIEREIVEGTIGFEVPEITIHSANSAAHDRMLRARNSIYRRIGREESRR